MRGNTLNMNESWYKQFWPWFLILLPATAVVASIITIILAVNNADDLVVDDYYKKAMQINRDLSKIEYAKEIDLSAGIEVKGNSLHLDVSFQKNKIKLAPALKILFVHPTESKKDFSVVVVQEKLTHKSKLLDMVSYSDKSTSIESKSGYIQKIKEGAWYVRLVSPDNSWQLNGKVKHNNKMTPLYAD